MGVDVNLYAVGEVSDEQLAEAEAYMNARVPAMVWDVGDDRTLLQRTEYPEPDRIEVNTGMSYYGLSYTRGDWPTIAGAILCLRAALPQCRVFYGGDTTDYGVEATDELLAEYGLHWLGPDGDSYHR